MSQEAAVERWTFGESPLAETVELAAAVRDLMATALMPSSALIACHARETSSHIVRLNAFSRSGRFNVIVATRFS